MAMVDKNSVAAGVYAATKNQILADTERAKAQARMWDWGGFSLGALCIGGAIWLGCAGYDRLIGSEKRAQEQREYEAQRTKEDAERNAAFLSSIKGVTIPVKGVVTLADGQRVMLADGGHVTASGMVGVSPNSTVGLDPATATVRAVTDAPRLTKEQLQPDARPASKAAVKTEVVKFNEVDFGTGRIETGWAFKSSADAAPSNQFCQYRQPDGSGAETVIPIGRDGRMTLPDNPPAGVDLLKAAFQNCVWWQQASRAPVDAPPSPHVIRAHAKG
jgi:hypothetical protein